MRIRAALLTVLAGAALVAVPAGPAAAAACGQASGVTVVVDFASLGGGTSTRCASGDPSSGVSALRTAGFAPTRAAQQPGYFVCRIDGKPASDPCQRTSPANAYWSYWHAKRGGSWTYSDLGAADYDPPPGTVEGWAFGAGKPPSTPPPAAAPAPAPAPRATTQAAAPTSPAAAVPPSRPSAPAAPVTTAAAAPARATASASASVIASTTQAPSEEPSPLPLPLAAKPVSGSSPVGPLLAAVVVALLVAAAVRTAVVRRRRDNGA